MADEASVTRFSDSANNRRIIDFLRFVGVAPARIAGDVLIADHAGMRL